MVVLRAEVLLALCIVFPLSSSAQNKDMSAPLPSGGTPVDSGTGTVNSNNSNQGSLADSSIAMGR